MDVWIEWITVVAYLLQMLAPALLAGFWLLHAALDPVLNETNHFDCGECGLGDDDMK